MRRSHRPIGILIITLLALGLTYCSSPVTPSGTTGKLSISLSNMVNAKTLAPSISMDVASYTITGTGPNSATFTATSTGAAVTESSLAFGSWTIVVDALNSGGTLIGTGTGTAQVNTGDTTAVSVTVTPILGTGTLSLTVDWPAAQVQTPSITASLTPALGSAQDLAFTVSGSTATYTNAAVGNGYYTLAFTVDDNGIAEAGAVEVVRIVTGQTTSGTYKFANVNQAGGAIQVNIAANMENPLSVAIAGASSTLGVGSTETLTASVSNYSGNVAYVWYVNGVSVGTGSSYTFGSGMTAGYSYRIDAVAFTADGTQAGSATTTVSASSVSPGSDWTARTLPSSANWDSVAYGNGVFVAVAETGDTAATSSDGTTWTARTLPCSDNWMAVTYGDGKFVALSFGDAVAATSPDGITWTKRTLPCSAYWTALTFGNGTFVAVSELGATAATSSDGITWTASTLPVSSEWSSVAYGNGLFVAVSDAAGTIAATSPDGITWTSRALPSASGWMSVVYGAGTFVAISQQDTIAATSPDGIAWTPRTLPDALDWLSVTYGNGVFVAIAGGSSAIATSQDGIDWTGGALPSSAWWISTTFGNGVFVAVAGNSASAATSQ